MSSIDVSELAALEQDLTRKIIRCSEEAAVVKKKISAELRRRGRKGEELERQERISFCLHADLVDGNVSS